MATLSHEIMVLKEDRMDDATKPQMVQECIFDRQSLAQMVCGFRLWKEMFREEEQIVLTHVLWVTVIPCLRQGVCLVQRVKDGSMLRK